MMTLELGVSDVSMQRKLNEIGAKNNIKHVATSKVNSLQSKLF